jgi:hypothetical protein
MRALRYAGGLYAVGLVLHTADHVRRGLDVLTPEVSVAGYLSIGGGLLVLALILYGHRLAPIAAVAYGLPAAIGTAASHLLPHWSSFSDAFPGAHGTGVTGVSWAVVLLEIAGHVALAVAGLACLRRERVQPTSGMWSLRLP